MTTDMICKQIYIHRRQQNLLRHLARRRGTSAAEVIRGAIDHEAALPDFPFFDEGVALASFYRVVSWW
jgi:hypothetical protein